MRVLQLKCLPNDCRKRKGNYISSHKKAKKHVQ